MFSEDSTSSFGETLLDRVLIFAVYPEECRVFRTMSLGVLNRELGFADAPKAVQYGNSKRIPSTERLTNI